MNKVDWLSIMDFSAENRVYTDKLFAGLGLTREILTGETQKMQDLGPAPSRYDLIRKKIYENQR